MGAIIRGFMSGAGKGMADASQMLLADQLAKEREDANYLRDKEINKQKMEYSTSERVAGQDYQENMEEQKTRARNAETLQAQEFEKGQTKVKLDADKENTLVTASAKGGGADSAAIKMATYLREQGYEPAIADGVASGAIEIIKDEKSGELTAINTLTGKKIGALEKPAGGKYSTPKVWVSEKDRAAEGDMPVPYRMPGTGGESAGIVNSQKPAAPAAKPPSSAAIEFLKKNDSPENRKAFIAKFGKLPADLK